MSATTADTVDLTVQFSTNRVFGSLVIDFFPSGDQTLPASHGEWPRVRRRLRDEIGDRLDEEAKKMFEVYLGGTNRLGERFVVDVGTVTVDAETYEVVAVDVDVDPENYEFSDD